jgi:putative phosphoesterase
MVIGVISDTHGLLRAEAIAALRGADLILHAGDVGKRGVLSALERIAPVIAVRGNVDVGERWKDLPLVEVVPAGTLQLYMLHKLDDLDLAPEAAGFAAVIYGHSHRPAIEWRKGVLYFNPGSAGPRRFRLPVSLGRLRITGTRLDPELMPIRVLRRASK